MGWIFRRWYSVASRRHWQTFVESLGPEAHDALILLYVDTKYQTLAVEIVARRDDFARNAPFSKLINRGLQLKAAGFFLFHKHPSGESPSSDDLLITSRFEDLSRRVEMRLFNSLVIAGDDVWRIYDGPSWDSNLELSGDEFEDDDGV
jgi:DNA repair protein RadC